MVASQTTRRLPRGLLILEAKAKHSRVRASSNQTTRETTWGVNARASQQPLRRRNKRGNLRRQQVTQKLCLWANAGETQRIASTEPRECSDLLRTPSSVCCTNESKARTQSYVSRGSAASLSLFILKSSTACCPARGRRLRC